LWLESHSFSVAGTGLPAALVANGCVVFTTLLGRPSGFGVAPIVAGLFAGELVGAEHSFTTMHQAEYVWQIRFCLAIYMMKI
jgi:hypothetical protein